MDLLKEMQLVNSNASQNLRNWYWIVMNRKIKKILILRKLKEDRIKKDLLNK